MMHALINERKKKIVRHLKLIVKVVELYDDLFSGKQTALVDVVECTVTE